MSPLISHGTRVPYFFQGPLSTFCPGTRGIYMYVYLKLERVTYAIRELGKKPITRIF